MGEVLLFLLLLVALWWVGMLIMAAIGAGLERSKMKAREKRQREQWEASRERGW